MNAAPGRKVVDLALQDGDVHGAFTWGRARPAGSRSAGASFVLDALEQAIDARRPAEGGDLIHHSDRGSQHLSIRYSERLGAAGIAPSVGSVGDSHDNALAETVIGPFKTEAFVVPVHGAASRPSSSDKVQDLPHIAGRGGSFQDS